MDIEFIGAFLDFVSDYKVHTESNYKSVTLKDGDDNEIAALNEDGGITIPMGKTTAKSNDFVELIVDYNVKIKPILSEYNIFKGFEFRNNKGTCLTITTDNKIVIPFK